MKIKLFREFIEGSDNIIDAKMQELKDLIDGLSDNSIIYQWENKSDHEVVVNFTANGLSIRYEFDIDQMYVAKFVGDITDFQTDVESIDEGLDIIEKDIQGVLGISEKILKNMKHLKLFENFENDLDYDSIISKLKSKGWGDLPHLRFIEFEESDYWSGTTDYDKYADEMDSYLNNEDESDYFESLVFENKNVPTNPDLWSQCKSWAKSKYDVWPSAYACGAAAKRYKSKGGKWEKKNKKK
jgi:hypothetical protein